MDTDLLLDVAACPGILDGDRRLPDGSRWVDARALLLMAVAVGGAR